MKNEEQRVLISLKGTGHRSVQNVDLYEGPWGRPQHQNTWWVVIVAVAARATKLKFTTGTVRERFFFFGSRCGYATVEILPIILHNSAVGYRFAKK